MKLEEKMKLLESEVAAALSRQFERIPFIDIESLDQDVRLTPNVSVSRPDILVRIRVGDRSHSLLCEVKEPGQPKQVRQAISQLHGYISVGNLDAVPIVAASYLSPEARELCERSDVGYLDLEGNCRIVFDTVYIERESPTKPQTERRSFRSLFSPKSTRVLRVFFRDIRRAWKVSDLAEAANVSLGHVSNVRNALLDREWARAGEDGLVLTEPDALLDAWRDQNERPKGRRLSFYTTLHSKALDKAVIDCLDAEPDGVLLAGPTAAQWLAPMLRDPSTYMLVREDALDTVEGILKLKPIAAGGNVEIFVPDDPALLADNVEIAHGRKATSPLQTYLDLYALDDRARDAAEHLRKRLLSWR
jgi:hypothetical protein